MTTLTETSRSVPTNEPALSIIFSELRTEINRYNELHGQLYSRINQLKYIPPTENKNDPQCEKIDKDCIDAFNTEISRLRTINNDVERITFHLYTVVGS